MLTVTGKTLGENLDWWETSERRTRFRQILREQDGVDADDVILPPEQARARGLTNTLIFPRGNWLCRRPRIAIQTVVAVIDADGASAAAPATAPAAAPVAVPARRPLQAAAPEREGVAQGRRAQPAPAPSAPPAKVTAPRRAPAARGNGEKIRSSPLVRRLAKEHNVDLTKIEGSGAGGRISKKDILAALESESARPSAPPAGVSPALGAPSGAVSEPPSVPPGPGAAVMHPALENAVPRERIYFGSYEAHPMSVMRQRIAEHMVASKRVSPHVYSIDEADMTRIAKIREGSKAAFEAKYGTKLTFMPFFVRACVEGLRAFPTVNASADGTTVVLHREINVGIAVALDWGLIVPVLKNSEEKNFLGLARGINDLAERARAKKLKPEEVQEGTFSITNPGVYGGLMGLPVINQPNVAILGHRRHPKACHGNRRRDCHPVDGVSDAVLRPPRRGRRDRASVCRQGEIVFGRLERGDSVGQSTVKS